jgi:hypothetical protein
MEIRARRYLAENFPAARSTDQTSRGRQRVRHRRNRGHWPGLAVVSNLARNEDDWGNKTVKIVIDIVQDKDRELGTTSQDISNVMVTLFNGLTRSISKEKHTTWTMPS